MGSRPTTNPRRGVLRAAVTVVVLTALLIVAILVVSSLSAPSVKAPTTPPTPGPITPVTTPTHGLTPGKTTPGAVPSPTHKKKTLGNVLNNRPGIAALQVAPGAALLARAADRQYRGVAVRAGNRLAWFSPSKSGSPFTELRVRALPLGTQRTVGISDSLVKPVWSSNSRYLLYVTASRAGTFPGARWTLQQYDARSRTSTPLATMPGIALTPLGWWHSRALFMLANGSDTSLYTVQAGKTQFVDVLAPQIITSAALAPGAPVIAFMAPTNCYNCTLNFFDLQTRVSHAGPSGILNESYLAWANDGRSVLTASDGYFLEVPVSGSAVQPAGRVPMSTAWQHSLRIGVESTGIRIVDGVTGRAAFSRFRSAIR